VAHRERRVAEEQERAAIRTAETAAREAAWQLAQRDRADVASKLATAAAAAVRDERDEHEGTERDDGNGSAELAAAEEHVRALRQRRESLTASVSARARQRHRTLESRRRTEVALAMDEARAEQVDGETGRLVAAATDASRSLTEAQAHLATASTEEGRLSAALREILQGSGDDRERRHAAEREATDQRERLRAAEGRSRSAEVAEMETRLRGDAVREQMLMELAGIGREGLAALLPEAGASAETAAATSAGTIAAEALPAALESALDAAMAVWQTSGDGSLPASYGPSPGRLAALRRRYHDLGASNPFAAEEYAEVALRLESLDAQRADMEGAIRSTRELIGQLSALISSQFRATFAALEGAFGRRFQQLFDGGEAQLALTDPEDLSRTGVEITARPPGKKRQPLAMLSGGERALTAVALLMAMLEVHPVPFCVLDEVDAALDEANIGRFSAALRSLAERIQFIVITHNRGTIEAADALYGVTVDDDAVSRVISLRLAELDPDTLTLVASEA